MIINEYDDKMRRARLPYDNNQKLFLEYDNFNTAQQNEETFAPYINFPLQRHMSYQEKKNLYDKYAIVKKTIISKAVCIFLNIFLQI